MATHQNSQTNKGKQSLLLLCAAFIIPIVLAKLALEQQWFNYGVTNQGQLLEQELTLTDLGLSVEDYEHKWLLIYNLPEQCDINCQQVLHSVNNTYIALGKEMPRVTPIALTNESLNAEALSQINQEKWLFKPLNSQANELLKTPQILIVDTLGNVVLSHALPKTESDMPAFGKAILADFKKLLKYSRIG